MKRPSGGPVPSVAVELREKGRSPGEEEEEEVEGVTLVWHSTNSATPWYGLGVRTSHT